MQIIIEMPDNRYKDILRIASVQLDKRTQTVEQIIANGTPLPKGHGDLIDRADILQEVYTIDDYGGNEIDVIDPKSVLDADTIIEADKE